MIDSIINRVHDKIIIDKLEVDGELVWQDEDIKFQAARHFQNVVGPPTSDGTIPDSWAQDYEPLSQIDPAIYHGIYVMPTFDEWYSEVRSAPINKAAGPSAVSYDLIKHLGPKGLHVLYNITCSCFKLKDIPKA